MNIFGRNWRKTCLSILLVVVCLVTSLSFLGIKANAETIRMGTVTASSLNFRKGPGTEYDRVAYVYSGDVGTILDEKKATTGVLWYQMNISGVVGWASSNYIKGPVLFFKL